MGESFDYKGAGRFCAWSRSSICVCSLPHRMAAAKIVEILPQNYASAMAAARVAKWCPSAFRLARNPGMSS
jgi:hypothetical protein